MCFVPSVDSYNWAKRFREVFEAAIDAYRDGKRDARAMFRAEDAEWLAQLGATTQEIFDLVEDTYRAGEPGLETALLLTAVRRDFFLVVQKGIRSERIVDMDTLPDGDAELGGIEWLPRIIAKANAKLRGEMPPELMYCCGGDRGFLREHGIHPADFLREVWAAGGDDQKILEYVRQSAANRPEHVPATVCQILPGGRVKC